MNKDFKKWLCENYNGGYIPIVNGSPITKIDCEIPLTILIKAMWAINEINIYEIKMDGISFSVYDMNGICGIFNFDNSEQEALTAALKYIYEKEEGK